MTESDIFNFCLKYNNISESDWNNNYDYILESNLVDSVFNLYYAICDFLNIESSNEFFIF